MNKQSMVQRIKNVCSLMVLCGSLLGCAAADRGQSADVLTTYMAFNQGFSEGNPIVSHLSIPQMAVIKLGITQGVKFLPLDYCHGGLVALTGLGYSAAIWNVGVMLGSGPAALPLAIGLVIWQWGDWKASSYRTCLDPWHFEPPTFLPVSYNDMK